MPNVSIITPVFNGAKFLDKTIASVFSQTYEDYELIIVDDGSTDNARSIAEGYVRRFPDKIRYIYQANGGHAKARNTGLKEARGQFIAFLDADDLWLPSRLEEEVRVLESDPSVGLVHANTVRITEQGELIRVNQRDKRYLSGIIFEYLFLRKADISIPTVLVRKNCLEKVGFFDENLTRLGCEDRELWLRIAEKYKVYYLDKVLAQYRVNIESASKDRSRMLKGRYYVIEKFASANKKYSHLRKMALARVHRDLADDFLVNGQKADARAQYINALRFWPLSFWTWLNLAKTYLKGK
ncbi:MAG: glycosyltransferase [Candidatus Omnitrophica bacterium]|nr:glycosyltransferase [Candidatus Omnitrophota bacterium]